MRILKEPLFHFILMGIAIFCWFAWISPQQEIVEETDTITIDGNDVALLTTRFETSWNRPPTQDELRALIDATVREEVLVREARKLGLDQGDQVIRARLAQKMDFLTDAIAASVEPEDDVLQAYLQENPERFTTRPQIAFDQVYLGQTVEADAIENAIASVNGREDWDSVGQTTLLPRSMPLSAARVVDSNFGIGFSSSLGTLEPGIWSGPVQSAFGIHLVRVTDKRAPKLPPLDEVRDSVLLEWRRETGAELAQAQYESLASSYRIETPEINQASE
ncbi:peptidyl-prolyl cis-trans isomerase [Ruegeria sp. Ofav3-42]|uniref:peptidylprolyl isomerase n=1 Tax=Ruegeria sp. Ofav3-42 TaxID=2917759 RepID=UPI001EF5AA88|nr:peptidylprolyl isomerase [Ruegeria sp. Ofav3-42]MCG7519787.1 peptidyl-prolyl cis-trans isomerase [Ruegeria sp. Ofav3-42]